MKEIDDFIKWTDEIRKDMLYWIELNKRIQKAFKQIIKDYAKRNILDN